MLLLTIVEFLTVLTIDVILFGLVREVRSVKLLGEKLIIAGLNALYVFLGGIITEHFGTVLLTCSSWVCRIWLVVIVLCIVFLTSFGLLSADVII